jgi:hypothetical protein
MRRRDYSGAMTSLSFWLDDWEYECCGDERKIGDRIVVGLSFDGPIQESDTVDRFETTPDGQTTLSGSTRSFGNKVFPWVVQVGKIEVGIRSNPKFDHVHGIGRLWEERHADPPATTGSVTSIKWWNKILKRDDNGTYRRVGFDNPQPVFNTEKRPGYPSDNDLKIRRWVEEARSKGLKGPLTIRPADMTDYAPTRWAFQFTIDVLHPRIDRRPLPNDLRY